MTRSVWHWTIVLGGVVAAVGLRAISAGRQVPPPGITPRDVGPSAVLIRPHDYVLSPVAALDERDAGPARIISVAPSITEMLCALGLGDRLIGRTQFCRYPPGIERVEVTGSLLDANYERMLALRPDLVLITENSGQQASELATLGLPFLRVPHDTLADVYEGLRIIGERCGRPRTAETVIRLIRADIEALSLSESSESPPEVLITAGSMPAVPGALFIAGPGAFLDELLRRTGHRNAAAGVAASSWGEVPLEMLLKIDPETILEFRESVGQSAGPELYAAWSKVGRLKAIEHRRVRCVGTKEMLSAGPRVAITLYHMRRALSENSP